MEYKIEKNVPIQQQKMKNQWVILASKMKVGDSVEVTSSGDASSLAQAINESYQSYQDINFKQKHKAIRRKISDNPVKYRVWKVKRDGI